MNTDNLSTALAETIAAALKDAPAALDETRVREIVDETARELITKALGNFAPKMLEAVKAATASAAPAVRTVEVVKAGEPPRNIGAQHFNFEKLFKFTQVRTPDGCRLNLYLHGPAGTGKTTAAKNLAAGLGLEYYSNGAISTPWELTGYRDASGVYHETPFYRAYKNGGVYLFDELDSSDRGALLAFNEALANGHANFCGESVARHPDCVILAGGNTTLRGDGAAQGYARAKLDAAFVDRFVFLDWPIDTQLEKAIAAGYGDTGTAWAASVETMRANVAGAGILGGYMITPRATVYGAALLAAGIDRDDVLAAVVRKGLPAETWNKIKE